MTNPLLDLPGAVAGDGADAAVAAHYGSFNLEQRALENGEGFVDLSHRDVVRIEGPDRLTWLHSLTTQHLEALAPGVTLPGLVLDPQGHVEHAFVGSDEGPSSATLAAWIGASPHSERMRMVPNTPEVQRWIGAADLLVCASDVESLPKSVLEAMAWEKPVLATAVFGLAETIEHGVNGWLCEAGDLGALAAGLDLAFGSDAETRQRIGAAARELVLSRHDLGAYAARIGGLLDAATG